MWNTLSRLLQVFSATLPWKSKPQGGVAGGLKRLSTFLRSAMSGSSGSFTSSNHNQHQQQALIMTTSATPGGARRQHFAGAWPSSSSSSAFVSSSTNTSGGNSMGVLNSAQSRSSYASDATLQPSECSMVGLSA